MSPFPFKRLVFLLLALLLAACEVETPPPAATPSPTATLTPTFLPPSLTPTFTPLPPTLTPTPYPVERLVFRVSSWDTYDDIRAVLIASSDGGNLIEFSLLEPFYGSLIAHLSWSPNGYYLAFDGANETDWGYFLANLEESTVVPLTHQEYHFVGMGGSSWSPDSRQVVLSLQVTLPDTAGAQQTAYNLFIIDIPGGERHRLSENPSTDIFPTWSPDGQWIVFVRYFGSDPYL